MNIYKYKFKSNDVGMAFVYFSTFLRVAVENSVYKEQERKGRYHCRETGTVQLGAQDGGSTRK